MKNILLMIFVLCFCASHAQDANKGHPEHIIAGLAVGGVTSYFVYKKTNNKFKPWTIGTGAATVISLAKELIDPLAVSVQFRILNTPFLEVSLAPALYFL